PGGGQTAGLEFRRPNARFPFIAMVPQWDFLDFITSEAARYPGFRLRMNAEVVGLVADGGVVRGVRYRGPDGAHHARALLTIGADGRSSPTRAAALLPLIETSPPMDVFWFGLSRRPEEPENLALRLGAGRLLVLLA